MTGPIIRYIAESYAREWVRLTWFLQDYVYSHEISKISRHTLAQLFQEAVDGVVPELGVTERLHGLAMIQVRPLLRTRGRYVAHDWEDRIVLGDLDRAKQLSSAYSLVHYCARVHRMTEAELSVISRAIRDVPTSSNTPAELERLRRATGATANILQLIVREVGDTKRFDALHEERTAALYQALLQKDQRYYGLMSHNAERAAHVEDR